MDATVASLSLLPSSSSSSSSRFPFSSRLEGHRRSVEAINLLETRAILLSVSQDGDLRIWSLKSKECLRVVEVSSGPLSSLLVTSLPPSQSQFSKASSQRHQHSSSLSSSHKICQPFKKYADVRQEGEEGESMKMFMRRRRKRSSRQRISRRRTMQKEKREGEKYLEDSFEWTCESASIPIFKENNRGKNRRKRQENTKEKNYEKSMEQKKLEEELKKMKREISDLKERDQRWQEVNNKLIEKLSGKRDGPA